MKKILPYAVVLASLSALFLSAAALAGPDIGIGPGGLAGQAAGKGGYDTAGVTETSLSQSIGRVIKVVLSLVGTIFLVLVIYAGILWMLAQGNEEQVTKAQDIIRAAVVGLVAVLAAYGLTVFVLLGITAAAGVPGAQVGGGGLGGVGFWQSFGNQVKQGGWQLFVP